MFLNFFNELREAKVPVTLKEYLLLMERWTNRSSIWTWRISITSPAPRW